MNTPNTPNTTQVTQITTHGKHTFEQLADFSEELKIIKASVLPGITPVLMLSGNLVIVQYRVRVMLKGKRADLGLFATRTGAIASMLQYKISGHTVVSQEEMQARQDCRDAITKSTKPDAHSVLDAVSSDMLGASPVHSLATKYASVVAPAASEMTMQALDDLVVDSETPGYLFTAESTLEITDSAGKVWHVSPAMQREYNAWCFANSAASQSAQASQSSAGE